MNSVCPLDPNNSDSVELISCISDLKEDKARNCREILKHRTEHKVGSNVIIISDSSDTIRSSRLNL